MDLNEITTILFDVGNTLVLVDYEQIADAAAMQGVALSVKDLKRAEFAGKQFIDRQVQAPETGNDKTRWDEYFRTIMGEINYPRRLLPALLKEIKELDRQDFGLWSKLNPDTPGVLETLRRRRYTLGVISNADGRISGLVEHLGIAEYFPVVIDSHVVGIEKPDPEIFEMALQRIGASAHETAYVGDLYSVDVLGARAAGLVPILLDPHGRYAVNNCIKISRLSQILDLFPGRK